MYTYQHQDFKKGLNKKMNANQVSDVDFFQTRITRQ